MLAGAPLLKASSFLGVDLVIARVADAATMPGQRSPLRRSMRDMASFPASPRALVCWLPPVLLLSRESIFPITLCFFSMFPLTALVRQQTD